MTKLNARLLMLIGLTLSFGSVAPARPPSTFDKIQSGSHLLARQPGGAPALSFSETELTFHESDLNPVGYRACNMFLAGGIAVDGFTANIERLSQDELAPLVERLTVNGAGPADVRNGGQNSTIAQTPNVLPTHRLILNNVNPGAVKLSGLGSSTIYLVLKRDDAGGETLRGRGLFLLKSHDVHVYTPVRGALFVKGLENAAEQSVQMTQQLAPPNAYYYLVCNLGIQ